jgi:PAS domain S-box-containing protein
MVVSSKSKIEPANSQREAQLPRALEHLGDTIAQLDFDGTVRWMTAGAMELFGCAPETLAGTNLISRVHPDDRVRLAHSWRMLRFGRTQTPCVYRTCHKDGRFIWTETTFRPLAQTARPETRELVAIMRDISWRVNSYGLLEGSEKLAEMLIDNVVDYAIYLLDLEGNVKTWNAGAQRITGYQAQEIIGANFAIFYTDDDAQAGVPERSLAAARATGKFEAEGWRVRKDGTRLWASVVIDPVRDHSGTLVGYAKITRDVTQRRTEQAILDTVAAELRFSAERLRLATQGARIGITDWDLVTNRMHWDPMIFSLYGIPESTTTPTYEEWLEFVHREDRDRAAAEVEEARSGTQETCHSEFRIVWPSGEVHHIRVVRTVVVDADGTALRIFGTHWDITELRTLAEQLREESATAKHAATHDKLTGLLNRRGFEEWIELNPRLSGSLLYLDIDGFKSVNDRFGHERHAATHCAHHRKYGARVRRPRALGRR